MSNPSPIKKKHILNPNQSADALQVFPVREETVSLRGVSNIMRFRMSSVRRFSFRDLSLSNIALRLKANREPDILPQLKHVGF